jgi:hypothetical protein
MALLASGVFITCPGSDGSLIDKQNGVQARLITISWGD